MTAPRGRYLAHCVARFGARDEEVAGGIEGQTNKESSKRGADAETVGVPSWAELVSEDARIWKTCLCSG